MVLGTVMGEKTKTDWTLVQRKEQDLHQFLISLTELSRSQELCDVMVRCEDGDISSHSLLLSAVSPFLHDLLLAQRSPYCEDSASTVLLLPDVKHRDLNHLLGCIVGLESYQSDRLQSLVQLLQIETKVERPVGKFVRFETDQEKENSTEEEEEEEVKQDGKSSLSGDEAGEVDPISESRELQLGKTNIKEEDYYEVSVEDAGNKIFRCKKCGKRCGDRSQLEKHKIKHSTEKNFICSVCGKRLKRQNSLDLHMRHHTGTRSYGCDECDQSYFTASALRNHKVCKHTVLSESWLCTFCGKAFRKKANLEQHVTLHTGEKKYQCGHCEKRFRSHSVYQNHVRAHLGKKEFVCQYCGKAFMQKSHLARHTATHTGVRKHSCPVCSKTFIEPGDVRKHLRTHSKGTAPPAARPAGEGDVKPSVAAWNIPPPGECEALAPPPPAMLDPADRPCLQELELL